jgi:predicted nucleic acid-binding protein
MRVLKIEDPTHIQLPEEVGGQLGLTQGDVVVITLEAHRIISKNVLRVPSTPALVCRRISRLAPRISIPCGMSGTPVSQNVCPMAEVLLDSDILIDHLRGYEPARQYLKRFEAGEVQGYLSIITVAELAAGQIRQAEEEAKVQRLLAFASNMDQNGLSSSAQGRLAEAQNMSQAQYQGLLSERQRLREVYAALHTVCDACMTLAAPGAVPIGLDWTGNPVFTVPTSLLGVPSLSLPVFEDDGLPLGPQLVGFTGRDADVFSVASAIMALFAD